MPKKASQRKTVPATRRAPRPDFLARLRRICARLPDVEESSRLGGQPHFYVDGRIFTGCEEKDGAWSFGVKVGLDKQALLITRPGIRVAKYVGRYGWIEVDESALQGPQELEQFVRLSYELIAGAPPEAPRRRRATASSPTARRRP